MAAVKTKRISTLIESQLPEFISTEYELFAKFLQKYYESQEVQGGPLDIINNIQKYTDIDYYEKNLLKQNDSLAVSITANDTTLVLNDASSFPQKNGYIRINNEIIFYAYRTDTELRDCSRGVSGNTTLGDLYSSSNFVNSTSSAHIAGEVVYNVSNLFLYALAKNFESQYLESFPEKYLKGEIDKRTLIKNIQKFYRAKGTDSSIKFVFNTIIAKDTSNKPEVYNPKDYTYKASKSDWISVYALKAKIISGNPQDLIGKTIVQPETKEYGYVSATVDNVYPDGKSDNEQIWNIVLAPETVTGEFAISTKTTLQKYLSQNDGTGKRINVFSTIGWENSGQILIGNETITFEEKNITQFIIKKRGDITYNHEIGSSVYKPVIISGSGVELLSLGVIYNLNQEVSSPYAYPGDKIQISKPGFETDDVKIIDPITNDTRWILSSNLPVSIPSIPGLQTQLNQVSTNISSIFEDDQYYYFTSSGFPSYKILDGSNITQTLKDQNILRIIRKQAIKTTEKYKTPKSDIGILLNGVRIYSHRDSESIRYGRLESISTNTQGNGYAKPPFVLVDGVPNKARAVLSGSVVDRYIVDTNNVFPRKPVIEVTSGRNARARAVVTGDEITSLIIEDPGEYYSSPPLVRITDRNGRGRFAEYTASVDTNGKIVGFTKISGGNFYNQDTVKVDIIPVGSGATAIPLLTEWNFNRFEKYNTNLDTEYGYVFQNFNKVLEYGYGHVGNPKSLRVSLNDNIGISGLEPVNKSHSPIIGFAYDGNPIYGPFAYEDPLNPQSSIVRMNSSYKLKGSRPSGPSVSKYPLGSFTNDYIYVHKFGSLDENNGRYCVTPDFPDGTYAYFLTIDSNQVPQYPYFIGENFYSLPVDSNYNSNINQNDIPKNSRRFYVPGMPRNGDGFIGQIGEVKSGTIDSIVVDNSSDNFSVDSKVFFNNRGSDGSEAEALVSSVKGKSVNYLDGYENKVVKLTTIQNAYLFTDDTLRQPSSNASGTIVGDVQNDNTIVLKNVVGTFDNTGTFSADIKTFFILLDQRSSYTKGAILSLTDGINPAVATAEVLNGTSNQNTVEIKVISGDWLQFNDPDVDYFLQSNNFFNTSGTRPVTITSLSDNLEPFEVNQSVALVETAENHGLGIGDKVNIDILPDDNLKTKTYYLRKRLYQEVTFNTPKFATVVRDTGIGRFQILNGGADYTQGTYSNVPLTGGSGSGATAIITVSNNGVVSNIQIQNKGSGYKKSDYLSVDDESLIRSVASQSTSRLTIYVDHVGFSAGSSILTVGSTTGFANGDLIKISQEVLEISSINGKNLNVITGREGTDEIDHYDGQEVTLYKPRYNFTDNFAISNSTGSGYIKSYDLETQKATIVFDYSTEKNTAQDLKISTTFFDSSLPQRLVSIRKTSPLDYKFEFSEDGINYIPNPNLDVQEYYRYVFDTSHSSLVGTYFDLSPSKNYNIITEEKLSSTILPGNPGAFTEVKFGFGSRISINDYQTKVGTDFKNFYYYDKNNIVQSDGKYIKIVSDPLQGEKTVNYVTPNRFVYDLSSQPLWDGSGHISYTSTGKFCVGKIDSFQITNLGLNYKKVPIIEGVDPNPNFKAEATVIFDYSTKTITGIVVNKKGSNYSKPKIVIIDGDGVDVEFDVISRNGEIFSITVKNPGKGYTYAPKVEIIEGDVNAYVDSSTIGIPQSINITKNGAAYHLDKTVSSKFTSKYVISLQEFSGDFQKGETVTQKDGNNETFRATVSEWRTGSNLLKVENIDGTIKQNVLLEGKISKSSGKVKRIYVSSFSEKITSFYNNIGFYKSDRGKIGVSNQRITDSYFYQDYSYVVRSNTPIDQWRDLIKSTTHPAGFKLFGQVDIETDARAEMPAQVPTPTHFSIIQLWDSTKNKITVENTRTRRTVTQLIQKVENNRIRRGLGSISTSEFNFNESRAFTVTLSSSFDGYYDNNGRLQGSTTFQLLNEEGLPFIPASAKNLIITLDGVIQEPEVAYTVFEDNIIFAQPPLGPYQKLTGNNLSEVSTYNGVTFYGRYFSFRENQYNQKYFRKIRNIFQRSGRWLDASNQISRNRTFIVEESIGYGISKYPSLDWNTKQDDYEKDIGHILDAYEHDIRFGGNVKTFDYASIFKQNNEYDYITNNKQQSLDIFKYATSLAKLAIRNWDVVENNVNYVQGSQVVEVNDTSNLAIGMYISSGNDFPSETRIISINSDTEITVSNPALVDVTSNQATFYLSGINSGTFYDASNLILANKEYLQEEISEYIYANYSLPQNDKEKCYRDLGYLIDAIVYHLRFGGNEKVVEFARLYYTNSGYPGGENLTYINRTQEETSSAIDAWNTLAEKMILAMRNSLGAGSYTLISPVVDPTIAIDISSPACQEVESSINTMIDIVEEIIANGTGSVDSVGINSNKSGYWTDTKTYTNYSIIPDPLLTNSECDDVTSSVDLLYQNLEDLLYDNLTQRSLPDYVDGKNKTFELYWDDGSEVSTEEDENLFITINAVIQRPKYNENYPKEDSYYIDRTSIPNKLVFDVAPIWDQDFGAKNIGEPTAVEKIIGVGVGNYKRLTIDYNLVNGVKTGPFIILDVEDKTVQNIDDKEHLYVFLDGVLQREDFSYTVSGPNIYFTSPIKKEMKVDMRYLYGRDVGQTLNIYDFSPDTYYSTGTLVFNSTSSYWDTFEKYDWMGDMGNSAIHCFQIKQDGTYNIIGKIRNLYRANSSIQFFIYKSHNPEILEGLDFVFVTEDDYTRTFTIPYQEIDSVELIIDSDDIGRKILKRDDNYWSGTYLKQPFVSLSDGDQIRIDGESRFRKIKKLPQTFTSKDGRYDEQVSDDIFGIAEVENYSGITRGEGLSVIANIEDGKVVSLSWNQRSFDPLTQPTAYQYYTPPVLKFIPLDGTGGGARAGVIVSKGQVISVDLIDGGSGYTKAPKVLVTRKYDILRDRDINISLVKIGINPQIKQNLIISSNITVLIPPANSSTIRSIFADSPKRSDFELRKEIQLLENNSDISIIDRLISFFTEPISDNVPTLELDTKSEYVSQVSGRFVDIVSNTIVTERTRRQITSTISNVINNTSLSNINYYEVGAYLEVDAESTDTIIYIPDTFKFKTNGYLLIGNEIVRYLLKLNDRFLKVTRGENNTKPQFWPAGTFIRQIPDPVSIAYGGVYGIYSESSVSIVGTNGVENITSHKQINISHNDPSSKIEVLIAGTFIRQIPDPVSITYGGVHGIYSESSVSIVGTNGVENITSYKQINISHNDPSSKIEVLIAKTFIRQIPDPPDPVSITYGGVHAIYSESSVSIVGTNGVENITSYKQINISHNDPSSKIEVLIIPPPSGIVDSYSENIYLDYSIKTRLYGDIDLLISDLIDDYGIVKRDGSVVYISNIIFNSGVEYTNEYTLGNIGYTIGMFDSINDDGFVDATNLTLGEINMYYSSMTIGDFSARKNSSYTLTGNKFNILHSSIQSPVTTSLYSGSIVDQISVLNTNYFPESGYIFTSSGSVIKYTSKTINTFDGCILYRGPNSISINDEIIPFKV